jgi:uncharacterized protein YkwD
MLQGDKMKNILFFLLSVSILGCFVEVDQKQVIPKQNIEQKEIKQEVSLILLNLHNKEREKKGLKIFSIDEGLMKYAQNHADKMISMNRLTHSNISSLLAKYDGYVGENIAYGQKDEESVLKAWMNSYTHRSNILGSYSKVGFGVAKKEDEIYWCVVFAN